MNMISWSAAILAGGRGRRLGGADKSALVIGTRSILDRQIALLRALTPHLLIVTNDRSRVHASGVRVVEDRIAGAGALGGVYTALEEASTDHVLIIGCDMPFLTGSFLTYLIDQAGDADVVVPRDARGWHPLCALYARRVSAGLHARIDAGDLRVAAALQDMAVRELGPDVLAPFDPDGRLLLNVNTPEDYERALSIADRERSDDRPSDLPTG